ncbi:Protein of unknown function [Granulicella rosea]|uniref:DUF3050 domain-containing protein n=1 Tax=Granulicella rosea TaxID=474952 RepID=A0A239KQQ3_9BACT|nr:DUF3050 domain-containing protein [Granulicella rosea]SNT20008.1 Protein of unknown function [Granulicella rosea]
MHHVEALESRLAPLYARLAAHPLYLSFETVEDLQLFMQTHVFAVWDFMSLLKSLQRALTCVDVPWTPSAFPESRRLVNEIVLGEESDLYEGRALSHFELYRLAMQQCGASTVAIDAFLRGIADGESWETSIADCGASPAARAFVGETFRVIATGETHRIAAAFTFGREDLIPDMFRGFIRDQNERLSGRLATFRWYLDRHIEVDGDEHGPMALRMIAELCGDDPVKWQQAGDAAAAAVEARIALWDGILASLRETPAPAPVY